MSKMLELKLNRIRKGLKAIDVAKELGISPGQFSKMENGYVDVPVEVYEKIEKILG